MEKSQSIKSIAKALGLFQIKMQPLKKDASNPFFKSKYVTLNNILENIELPLQECELTFTQFPDGDSLTTILIHIPTGEYFEASYKINAIPEYSKEKDKNGVVIHRGESFISPQSIGSAITYARRYALGAILSLNIDIDDDGNHASGNIQQPQPTQTVNHNVNVAESKKEWLNKFEKDGSTLTEKWQKAKVNLEAGKVTLEQIKSKYIVSKINQDELLTFVK